MVMPRNIGAVDTMLGFPHRDMKEVYRFITRQTRDTQSKEEFDFPVEYMFKDVPDKALQDVDDLIAVTVREMDLWGIEKGLIGVGDPAGTGAEAMKRFPDRFIPSSGADPNEGMAGVNRLVREHRDLWNAGRRRVSRGNIPPGRNQRQEDVSHLCQVCRTWNTHLLLCRDTGPATKASCQHVELIDEVMYDFPDLIFVTPPGCEPWTELAVKLMLKWPGLHYSTSAFAPKYYPKDIIDYANSRGSDKIIYAGYFPMGLSLERIMTEMTNVGFKDEVWPKFLPNERSESARPFVGSDPHDSVARNH